jgi:hypothetical protein
MGWLGNFLNKVSGESPTDLIFVPSLPMAGANDIGSPIVPDECYIEMYIESLRLTRARKFASTFHGVVYSFVDLAREGTSKAQFAAVSKPDKLAALDPSSLDRVITVSRQMLGAVAWRGGTLDLELGLFSVKSGNLLTPMVDYVARVSSAAGASFVGAVKPFLPLISEGMDMIAGQSKDTVIEVAVDTNMALTKSRVCAIVSAQRGTIDDSKLSVDKDGTLLLNGVPLDRGYCVFSIRAVAQKADYGEIPELKEKYAAIQDAIKRGSGKDAQDALTAFRLATIASPDLIPSDASKLVVKAEQKVRTAFPPASLSIGGKTTKPKHEPESLSAIGLYT